MPQITRDSIMTLETYAKHVKDFVRRSCTQEKPESLSRGKCYAYL